MKSLLRFAIAALLISTLTGCMGGLMNRVSVTYNRHITIGQELMDLQKAHEAGILSDEEYEDAKEIILNTILEFEKYNKDNKDKKK